MAEVTAVGSNSATGTADTETVEVIVDANDADELNIYVDDNAGGTPATYDLSVSAEIDEDGTYIVADAVADDSTAVYQNTTTTPANDKAKVTLTNDSAGSADYRLVVMAVNTAK